MQLYDMSQECVDEVKSTLDLEHKGGIYSRILTKIADVFGHNDYYSLNPNDLEDLATKLRSFESGEFVPNIRKYVKSIGSIIVFNFYTDVCNVFDVIKDNINYKLYQEPMLIVNTKNIYATLQYRVEQYLNREEEE